MAGTSLFALLDDIASILDDVALMSKVAAKKTAGVLGDDLALNAQQLAGMRAERELPVVWAVGVGSLKNKAILVPAALAISAWAPWAITPLLMVGGAYLCYEGVEKLAHPLLHGGAHDDDEAAGHAAAAPAAASPRAAEAGRPSDGTAAPAATATAAATAVSTAASAAAAASASAADTGHTDPAALEREKIRGAIRTDFVLSSEIIVIALGTVADASFAQQVVVLIGIAIVMTFGVYGIVAAIVKLDDAGLYLSQRGGAAVRAIGGVLLTAAPKLMKLLSVVGTVAMFTVGGGILMHGLPALAARIEAAAHAGAATPVIGPLLAAAIPVVLEALVGVVAGALVLALVGIAAKALRFAKGRAQGLR